MKINGVFEQLIENPSNIYFTHNEGCVKKLELSLSDTGYFRLEIFDEETGNLICSSVGSGGFNGNIMATFDWQLLRKPVDFMTAINSRKRIMFEEWLNFYEIDKAFEILAEASHDSARRMVNGKWFIE